MGRKVAEGSIGLKPAWRARHRGILVLAAMLAAGGCVERAPVGQVIALVGDDDLTRRDVAAELRTPGSPAHDPAGAVALLIDRKLLVQEARQRRLDRSPEYLAAMRRHREVLLAAMLVGNLAADLAPVLPAEAADYVQRHPWMFARREHVRLDEIVVASGAVGISFSDAMTMDRIAAMLQLAGRRFERSIRMVDIAMLPEKEARRILAARVRAPMLLQASGPARIGAVVERRPAPVTGRQATVMAMAALRAERAARVVQERIEAQRGRTRIAYQQGFGPAAR